MKRTTVIAGFTALTVGLSAIGGAAFAKMDGGDKDGGKGGRHFNFEEVDTNGDGKITQDELDAHRAAKFAESDTDGDGVLSAEELTAAADAKKADRKEKRLERMIKHLDADGDGKLSAEEMAPKGGSNMIEKLDTDGDGAVSKEELEKGMKGKRKGHGKKGGHGEKRQGDN
jgi:Ca2+-binding EF-hand superfamily protein